jgi:hypothetical protein
MSTFTKLTWPVQDLSAVCTPKLLARPANVPFVLDGTLVDTSIIPNQASFIKAKMIRSVSITSATIDYSSGVSFIIQGLQNGAYVSETIPATPGLGPGIGETVYGTQYYDIIISVTATADVTGITVGTGDAGFLPLIVVNTVATVINYSATVLVPVTIPLSGINYSLFQTLDEVSNNFISLQSQIDNQKFFPALGFTGETASKIGNSSAITNFVLLKVNSSALPITDTFDFIFLQE